MPRKANKSWSPASSWRRETSRRPSRSPPSAPPPPRERKSKPREAVRSDSSSSPSRTRKGLASGSWGEHADRRCDGTRGGPVGLRHRQASPQRRGDRRGQRGERDRHGEEERRVYRVPNAPPTREHDEPHAGNRPSVPETA